MHRRDPGTVHVADSVDGAQSRPRRRSRARRSRLEPFLLIGQMTTNGPDAVAAGTESMWAYTHVPQNARRRRRRGHHRGLGPRRHRAVRRPHAATHRAYAPGFAVASSPAASWPRLSSKAATPTSSAVRSTAERRSSTSSSSLVPTPDSGARATDPWPLPRGLSAHPGGGVHGAPGNNAARAVLRAHRLRRL